ncbi:MAG: anthranilate phosphoribosyltransferase [Planctomycetota bacterium]
MSDGPESPIAFALGRVVGGGTLDADTTASAVAEVIGGRADPVATGGLLAALATRGETVDELVGAARTLRSVMRPTPVTRAGVLDTCGTGGDGASTFNISTATAIVVSACGVPVAKHGNHSVSSKSGSADVLLELGVKIDLEPEAVGACVDEIGLGFCFARVAHAAMRHAAPVRRALGVRTLFNQIGPLSNPAGAEFQLLGAWSDAVAARLAGALGRLGTTRAAVVCGDGAFDEVALSGVTKAFLVEGEDEIREVSFRPEDFGVAAADPSTLAVGSPAESAAVINGVLAGDPGPARDIVVANAAVALMVARGTFDRPADAAAEAAEAITDGRAADRLEALVEATARG